MNGKVAISGFVFLSICSIALDGCFINSVCYDNADCPPDKVCFVEVGKSHGQCLNICKDDGDCPDGYLCDPVTGVCLQAECKTDDDCEPGFECKGGRCVSEAPLVCSKNMVPIENMFCIDIYEASKPDATEIFFGLDDSRATSRKGVIPWMFDRYIEDGNAEAERACKAAGKTLCTESQWSQVCSGSSNTVYAYGDEYNVETCNGIDTYCNCFEGSSCQDRDPCPFPHCYSQCGGMFRLEPTGFFPDCKNEYGVFDMNGNLWEHVKDGDDKRVRGGAYNCANSEKLHRCDYIPLVWVPSALGFRCCSLGVPELDAGLDSGVDAGASK